MKKNVILIFITMLTFGITSAQVSKMKPLQSSRAEAGDVYGNGADKVLGVWALPSDGSTSGNTRIPGNTWRYQRTQYLITPAEMAASGFPSGYTIDAIGFLIATAGVGQQTGNLKIYLRNTTDVAYSLGTNWTTTGFTLASDIAAFTVPIAAGSYTIPFSGGSAFTYTGGGVYVAFEFSNPAGALGTTALAANCNTSLVGGLYGQRNATSMPTVLAASNWRPATQFINNTLTDIASVTNIYTLEKVAVGYGTPTPIGVRVANVSTAQQSFTVTVTVKDLTNTTTYYSLTQNVTNLAAGAATILNFTGWTPTVLEDVNITAETSVISGENWTSNNSLEKKANVNSNTLSYVFNTINPLGFGFTYPGTGIFAAKFQMNGTGSVNGANIVISSDASVPGNTIYAVVMNSSGTILDQSANYIVQAGDLGATKNFTFSAPPLLNNQEYYIGLAQTAGTSQWYPLGTFDESPQRDATFYTSAITGGALTLLPPTFNLKYGIEAVVGAPPTCLQPTALNATSITQTSANLSWTPNGSATAWEYVYGVAPLPTPSGSGTATTSSTTNPISGLSHSTTYQFYVRSNCGSGSFSTWAGPYTFTTVCNITTPPFTETFESAIFPPTCWTTVAGSGSWGRSVSAGGYGLSSASAFADFYNIQGSTPFDLISLDFITSAMTAPQLSFDYAYATYATEVDSLKIYYSTNGGTAWTLLLGMAGGTAGPLNTGGAVSTPFVPTPSQWGTRVINLPAGTNKVKFTARSAYGNNLYVDNIKVEEAPPCVQPTALTATNITTTTAQLGWTQSGTALSWDIELILSSQSPTGTPTATGVTNPYTYPGLIPSTSYKYYVRANCSGGQSTWAGPLSFNTVCDALVVPVTENFDTTPIGDVPVCWSRETNTNQWRVASNVGAYSAPNAMVTYYNTTLAKNDWFFSPPLQLTGGVSYDVSFYVQAPGWNGTGESMEVKWGTSASVAGMTGGTIYSNSNMLFASFTYAFGSFTPATTGTYYIGWHANSVADLDFIAVDNVSINETPACNTPYNLNASSVTQNSAELAWSQIGSVVSWDIEIDTAGFAPSGTPTYTGVGNPYSLSGLSSNTEYEYYVRAFCGGTDYSTWAGPFAFATLCDPYALPYVQDFELGAECWSAFDYDGGGESWILYTNNHTPGGGIGVEHFWSVSGYYEMGGLFSPQIILPFGSPVTISFWSFNVDSAVYGQNLLLISADGFTTWDTIWAPATVGESVWEETVLDLSSYSGNTVEFAFIYEGTYAHGWVLDDISIYVPVKTLNLEVLFEGLYDSNLDQMQPAQDFVGNVFVDKFGPDVADVCTVELHNATPPYYLAYVKSNVPVDLDGNLILEDLPGNLSGNFYIVVKHRNSIETWSSVTVDYTTYSNIFYTFTSDSTQAYGNNLKPMGSKFAIYGGNIIVDDNVEAGDIAALDNAVTAILKGYVQEDLNGDGQVDATDVALLDNNVTDLVKVYRP